MQRIKSQQTIRRISILIPLFLLSCALSPERTIPHPIYIGSHGKDGYTFSILLTRQLEKKQQQLTQDPTAARSHIYLQGPRCHRSALLLAKDGARTDFRIRCTLHYKIIVPADNLTKEGTASTNDYLIRAPNLSAYYRREEALIHRLKEQLAQQLIRALIS